MSISISLLRADFAAGERLEGVCTLILPHETHHKGLILKVVGVERTHWTETRSRQVRNDDGTFRTETWTETFQSKEHPLREFVPLLAPPYNVDHVHMLPGTHQFPFAVPLPANLPGSVRFLPPSPVAVHGHLTYKVKAFLRDAHAAGTSLRAHSSLEFRVHQHTHPSTLVTKNQPFDGSKSKTFNRCCLLCCLQSGPLTMHVQIPDRLFFVPREEFSFALRVQNESERVIERISVRMVQTVTLSARGAQRQFTQELGQTDVYSQRTVFPSISMSDAQYTIPADLVPLSTCRTTRLIDVDYALVVECHMADTFARNLPLRVPIILTAPCCQLLFQQTTGGAPTMLVPAVILPPPPQQQQPQPVGIESMTAPLNPTGLGKPYGTM